VESHEETPDLACVDRHDGRGRRDARSGEDVIEELAVAEPVGWVPEPVAVVEWVVLVPVAEPVGGVPEPVPILVGSGC
jgi:hypothetical protein